MIDDIALIEYLSSFITPTRLHKMQHVVQGRTHHVALVLEDIFQAHNMSACLRSAECFGVQNVHIIEQQYHYKVTQSVAKGAGDWLDLHRYNQQGADNLATCYQTLRSQGYTILATSPHATGYELYQVPLDKKVAVVFGTEDTGMSERAIALADGTLKIPMYGFTESFNISVSVALVLYDLTHRLRATSDAWRLQQDEQTQLLLAWLRRAVRGSEQLERRYYEERRSS
jgi:tRNA (guanosine-2'-O-)-methyltransferase